MKKKLIVPEFKNEDEEIDFWDNIDISEYLDGSDFKHFVFGEQIKPKTKKVTIRIPENWIKQAKVKANKMDVPYQSLFKQYIEKGLNE